MLIPQTCTEEPGADKIGSDARIPAGLRAAERGERCWEADAVAVHRAPSSTVVIGGSIGLDSSPNGKSGRRSFIGIFVANETASTC